MCPSWVIAKVLSVGLSAAYRCRIAWLSKRYSAKCLEWGRAGRIIERMPPPGIRNP